MKTNKTRYLTSITVREISTGILDTKLMITEEKITTKDMTTVKGFIIISVTSSAC